jgi:NAD(P)-dependent dehydrogenase (short-subunit alcohol dehydrogenase family)
MNFTNKIAIVTGGASGLGAATVREFAHCGAAVAILDINQALGEAVAAELKAAGCRSIFVRLDVSDAEACKSAVSEIAAKFGRIDYLINSAVSFISLGLSATRADWERSLGVNVVGSSNMAQACYPYIKKVGGGAIVNISSISGHIAQRDRWTYNACKGAIISLTRCQALDFAMDGIRVNSVSPGWTWTPEVEKAAVGGRDKWEPLWGRFCPMQRIAEASEIAKPILFLCSDAASFITGADLPVDGGYLAIGSEGLGDSSTFAGTR